MVRWPAQVPQVLCAERVGNRKQGNIVLKLASRLFTGFTSDFLTQRTSRKLLLKMAGTDWRGRLNCL